MTQPQLQIEVHEVSISNEVTCDDLGLIETRKKEPVLRAAKKMLKLMADAGGEIRIYWERWSPLTREMVADMILGDVVVEKVVTYFGGHEDCFLRLTNKGRAMLDRIAKERLTTTRVA